jgi:BlaI family penicillinase repressor
MSAKKPKISESEWKVLQLIWEEGESGAAEVIDRLAPENDWNHRTVRTLLRRLVNKKALRVRKKGTRYLYSPNVSRKECVRRESDCFLDRIFHGDVEQLLVHFVQEKSITSEQLASLKAILKRAEKGGDDA